jgi:hypothetical protein
MGDIIENAILLGLQVPEDSLGIKAIFGLISWLTARRFHE